MGFLLVILFFLIVFNSISYANRVAAEQQKLLKKKIEEVKETKADFIIEQQPHVEDFVVEDVVKFCPPHKWRYQEVRNTQGETVRYRIICDLCGPLKPSNGPAKVM